ncbi:hypothetical protein GCM10009115_05580 [Sphingopyxis soli]|uniref:Uncharacterized protein n=1 Tax=Sphingopyxis soli TaxID=592051 RepID=A0ABN1LXT9_9SPHN
MNCAAADMRCNPPLLLYFVKREILSVWRNSAQDRWATGAFGCFGEAREGGGLVVTNLAGRKGGDPFWRRWYENRDQ